MEKMTAQLQEKDRPLAAAEAPLNPARQDTWESLVRQLVSQTKRGLHTSSFAYFQWQAKFRFKSQNRWILLPVSSFLAIPTPPTPTF